MSGKLYWNHLKTVWDDFEWFWGSKNWKHQWGNSVWVEKKKKKSDTFDRGADARPKNLEIIIKHPPNMLGYFEDISPDILEVFGKNIFWPPSPGWPPKSAGWVGYFDQKSEIIGPCRKIDFLEINLKHLRNPKSCQNLFKNDKEHSGE